MIHESLLKSCYHCKKELKKKSISNHNYFACLNCSMKSYYYSHLVHLEDRLVYVRFFENNIGVIITDNYFEIQKLNPDWELPNRGLVINSELHIENLSREVALNKLRTIINFS